MSAVTTTPGFRRLAALAAALALVVVVFGAFVRLSNAGLSCPDWPTCYGRLAWPKHEADIARANEAFPERPVESHKAWREQVHRFLAGGLIVATFALAGWAWRRRHERGQPWKVPIAASFLIVFQALLGMWTVTWKLKPIVVMAHLLGGMATFALLCWIAFRSIGGATTRGAGPKRALIVVGITLLALQIALGGWTSANYAALACGMDYPTCLGSWRPQTDFREAFVLWRGIGVDYEGGVLDGTARTAINLSHRWFAVLVAGHLLALAWRCTRLPGWRTAGFALAGAVAAQFALGIANVLAGLPLAVASAHNAGAAVLLAILTWMLARATPRGSAS